MIHGDGVEEFCRHCYILVEKPKIAKNLVQFLFFNLNLSCIRINSYDASDYFFEFFFCFTSLGRSRVFVMYEMMRNIHAFFYDAQRVNFSKKPNFSPQMIFQIEMRHAN